MRLIDADELKKVFADYGETAKFTQGFCQQLIDNASTVEPETMRLALIEDIRQKQVSADKA